MHVILMSEYHYLTLIDLISETYAIRKIQFEEDPYFRSRRLHRTLILYDV